MTDGTRSIRIEADALDAAAFDQTIAQIADTLAQLGDQDLNDVRRAKAVGVIADPQTALHLLTDGVDDADNPDTAPTGTGTATGSGSGAGAPERSATAGTRGGERPGRRPAGKPRVTLYLHLHESAITTGAGVGRAEGLGPATIDQIKTWLARSDVTVKPVIDLDNRASIDAYEVPDRTRETVLLRNPCCPFPWCTNLTRNKDIDHIEAYEPPDDGGPPDQTAAHKLAPPCRRHPRLKTHGGWTYTMPEPGIYLWRSPHGRRYLVDHTGTATLQHAA